jgi:hypothetical protein
MRQQPIRAELIGGNISSARCNARFTFVGGKAKDSPAHASKSPGR